MNPPYRYFIVGCVNGEVLKTNDEKAAINFSKSEYHTVIDTISEQVIIDGEFIIVSVLGDRKDE